MRIRSSLGAASGTVRPWQFFGFVERYGGYPTNQAPVQPHAGPSEGARSLTRDLPKSLKNKFFATHFPEFLCLAKPQLRSRSEQCNCSDELVFKSLDNASPPCGPAEQLLRGGVNFCRPSTWAQAAFRLGRIGRAICLGGRGSAGLHSAAASTARRIRSNHDWARTARRCRFARQRVAGVRTRLIWSC